MPFAQFPNNLAEASMADHFVSFALVTLFYLLSHATVYDATTRIEIDQKIQFPPLPAMAPMT
jgi:hypothetical protein